MHLSPAARPRAPRTCLPRHLQIALLPLLLAAASFPLRANASEVKLTSGVTYDDVTIIEQSPTRIIIQVPSGRLTLPASSVASIDGAPLTVPAPALPPVASPPPAAASSAPAQPSPSPAPTVEQTPTPSQEPTPTPPPGSASTSAGKPYVHDWTMDIVILVSGALIIAWLGSLVHVQAALRKSGSHKVGWNLVPLFLPGLGFLIFKAFGPKLKRPAAPFSSPRGPDHHPDPPPEREPPDKAAPSRPPPRESSIDTPLAVAPRPDRPGASPEAGNKTVERLLDEAFAARASDIHIDPQESEYRVRFRVDGLLEERAILEKAEGIRVVSALKTLGEIDVAEKRKGQDGRFRSRINGRDVDMRISTANSIFGEKVVIRVMDRRAGIRTLSELGMSEELVAQFNRAIQSRSGMILAAGPTGAGKTSTLYSAIHQLDRKRRNVMTIEDPVESEIDGATQIPVNVKAGVTYESGLRSILRQDPDVILVGEIRDPEAAQIAVRAAMTGTLVFSSLHAKDSLNTILRLQDMGVEYSQMSSALLMLIAQRLVRILCPECREPHPCTGEELFDIDIGLPAGETIFRPKGCPACSYTGYHGRKGIFELFVFDDEIRHAVARKIPTEELHALLRARGFSGYREAGARDVLLGVTSTDEVLKAS